MVNDRARFRWPDYLVLVGVLVTSAVIGLYHGFTGRRKATVQNYLLADRKLNWMPVAISILATLTSVGMYTGIPAESYVNGLGFALFSIGQVLSGIISAYVFVPLLFPLKLTSTFEYLERRYQSKSVRIIGALSGIVSSLLHCGVLIYAAAAAISSVSVFSLGSSITCLSVLGTLYTSLGGMKAVIWTDVFQCCIMLIGMVGVIIQGTLEVGGFMNVWNISKTGGRLSVPTLNPDPRIQYSVWSLVIGATFSWLINGGVQQTSVQRFSSVPSISAARKSVLASIPGLVIFTLGACLMGIVVYSYYHTIGCDPLANGDILALVQIVPFFVTDVLSFMPGFPGLFMSSICCSTLSTVSSGLNSLSAILWEDMLSFKFKTMSERNVTILLKAVVSVFGIIMMSIAFLTSHIKGTFVQIAVSFFAATGGPMLGLYFLGASLPQANWIGAVGGVLTSLVVCLALTLGALTVGPAAVRPLASTSGCSLLAQFNSSSALMRYAGDWTFSNVTLNNTEVGITSDSFSQSALTSIFRISYLYYALIGVCIVLIVGSALSFLTGPTDPATVDPKLLFPCAQRFCTRAFGRSGRSSKASGKQTVANGRDGESLMELEVAALRLS